MINKTLRNPKVINENWLKPNRFFTERFEKNKIVLHHTASGESAIGDINWWNSDKRKIATAFIIDGKGVIHRTFNENMWAYHIGIGNPTLEQKSIGIELTNWGWLDKDGFGNYRNWTGRITELEDNKPYEVNWRGKKYWQPYTASQMESLNWLLKQLCEIHNIPKPSSQEVDDKWFNHINWKESGAGIYSHSNFRIDKTDCYPNADLIDCLNSI